MNPQERTLNAKLHERIKELNCLYAISKIAENDTHSVESFLQSIVDIIPSGFQHSEQTYVKANINEIVFMTTPFKSAKEKFIAPIYVEKKNIGSFEIYQDQKSQDTNEAHFLKEEKNLIHSISELVGRILGRLQTKNKLKETEARYRILTDRFINGITIIQNGKYQFVNLSFSNMAGYASPKNLVKKEYKQFISKKFLKNYIQSTKRHPETNEIQNKIEYKFITKNKKEIWLEESRNVIDWESSPALLCITRDVSKRKEEEAASNKETTQLRKENILLRSSLKERYRFQNIIGKSEPMQHVYDQILSAAHSDANVSVSGESGTGKELVSKAIHDLSERGTKGFITINCGAIPESLLESEFFGYKKGSFTGANIDKHGFLDLANKGTLFLDEVTELSLNMQAKLLRAIDGGGYNPIGSTKKCNADFRIIAASNKNLKKEVNKGNMREDFYYRIQVIPIELPPLRDRKEDIPLLSEHFTKSFSIKSRFDRIPNHMINELYNHDWAGNVRELKNVLHRFFSTGVFEISGLR